MKQLTPAAVSLWLLVSAGAAAQTGAAKTPAKGASVELIEVSGSVERPGGGDPLGFTLRVPKGAHPSPAMLPHNRGYGVDIGASHLSFAVFRLTSEGSLDPIIAYRAGTYGGLAAKQELEKGSYLVVLKPMDALQSVFFFKRVRKGEHLEVECTGPPSHLETLRDACGSFKATTPISADSAAGPSTGSGETAATAASAAGGVSHLTAEQESALRSDLEKMIGSDRTTRRAAALAKLKGGMYCDKIKKQYSFDGKCQFGKPSTLTMPAGDNPLLAGDYKLEFDGMTFQLKQAVADFKPQHDKEGLRKVAVSVFEAKWGPAKVDASNPDRLSWPGKGGTMALEYIGDHWQFRDIMMAD